MRSLLIWLMISLPTLAQSAPHPVALHMEFTPRDREVWVSVRDAGKGMNYDTQRLDKTGKTDALDLSEIFFTTHAHRIGL